MRERADLLEQTLARAADRIGDITHPVMALYYERHPEAETAFDAHALGNRAALEGDMVERILYCLMYWLESPGEIEIMLTGSVIHHADTLHVTPLWFDEMVRAAVDVIAATIPPGNSGELSLWQTIGDELRAVIRQGGELALAPATAH